MIAELERLAVQVLADDLRRNLADFQVREVRYPCQLRPGLVGKGRTAAKHRNEFASSHRFPGFRTRKIYISATRSESGLFAVIEAGECHAGAAAIVVVLDQKPWTDAMHPHPAA